MARVKGSGTTLKLSISSVFTTIAQLTSITTANLTRNKIETSDLASTVETSTGGIKRSGQVSFVGHYDPAATTHTALYTSYDGNVEEAWKVTYTDAGAGEDAFSGWISSLQKGEANIDGLVEIRGTIEVTGAITFSA